MKRYILFFLFAIFFSFHPAHSAMIILTSDQQLSDLQDPDKKIDQSTGYNKVFVCLREICEE